MKVTCPTCGRGTLVDAEIGDFPTRCQRCGGLLRKPPAEAPAGPTGLTKGLSLRRADPPGGPSARISRGTLAGLLSARPAAEFDPAAPECIGSSTALAVLEAPAPSESATAVADPQVAAAPPAQQVVLRPESRREIARVAARQKALRRAQLRGNLQALGALGWVGLIVIGILVVSVLVLQAHAMWQHS